MSRSLLLPRQLSPAVVLGVSHEAAATSEESVDGRASVLGQTGRRFSAASNDFPRQPSAAFGTQLAAGAPKQAEELPIRAA